MYGYETLTAKQKRILQLLAYGKKVDEICKITNITPSTVRTHTDAINDKLCTNSKVKAMIIYWLNNIEELKNINIEEII
jgi:DNA-binding NarL/FixJ family response regulator